MKTLLKYKWVKLNRSIIDAIPSKGIMKKWANLAAGAAFRPGKAKYCGYINDVDAGEWVGGVVGIKSILGMKSKAKAFESLERLTALDLIATQYNPVTKKLAYRINDWMVEYSGALTDSIGAVYASNHHGFICIPRNITQRWIDEGLVFGESDAWLDLWCHTVQSDPCNALSSVMPIIQYKKTEILLTLDKLGARWKWEKTKVWRFFQKYKEIFHLVKLPGSQGCVIANRAYDPDSAYVDPSELFNKFESIASDMRTRGINAFISGSDHEKANALLIRFGQVYFRYQASPKTEIISNNRVALSAPITRAYLSPALLVCNAIKSIRSVNDCRSVWRTVQITHIRLVRGP